CPTVTLPPCPTVTLPPCPTLAVGVDASPLTAEEPPPAADAEVPRSFSTTTLPHAATTHGSAAASAKESRNRIPMPRYILPTLYMVPQPQRREVPVGSNCVELGYAVRCYEFDAQETRRTHYDAWGTRESS